MKRKLDLCLSVMVGLLGMTTVFAGNYPVTWSKDLGLNSKADIAKLMQKKVGDNVLELVNDNNQKVQVTTCTQYDKAVKRGYYALTSYAMSVEGAFVGECGSLQKLQNAKAAKQSYLADFNIAKDYGQLPAAIVFPSMTGPGPNGTVTARYPGATVMGQGVDYVQLQSKKAHLYAKVSIQARGDFNGDGIQDLMLATGSHAMGGTAGGSNVVVVTKRGSNQPIQVVH